MLQFQDVHKAYGADPIVDIPSFELEKGLYWLHGPNGSGKTTLLRMVAGILPFRGDIRLQGLSQRQTPVGYRRLVAWADAEPVYPDFLTGAELIRFYTGILNPEKSQIDELCDRLQIRSWLSTRAAGWSSGTTKKLSLLLAFLGRPALIVLDEPFTTLDEVGTTALCGLIADYQRQFETSFLLSSHHDIPLSGVQKLQLINRNISLSA